MKGYNLRLFWILLLLGIAIPNAAYAQGSMAAAQPHLDKAKVAAWRPADGLNDLTHLYEVVCAPALSPKGPGEPPDQAPPPLSERKVPARADWYQEPAKVFDNLYWLGSWGTASRVPPNFHQVRWRSNGRNMASSLHYRSFFMAWGRKNYSWGNSACTRIRVHNSLKTDWCLFHTYSFSPSVSKYIAYHNSARNPSNSGLDTN